MDQNTHVTVDVSGFRPKYLQHLLNKEHSYVYSSTCKFTYYGPVDKLYSIVHNENEHYILFLNKKYIPLEINVEDLIFKFYDQETGTVVKILDESIDPLAKFENNIATELSCEFDGTSQEAVNAVAKSFLEHGIMTNITSEEIFPSHKLSKRFSRPTFTDRILFNEIIGQYPSNLFEDLEKCKGFVLNQDVSIMPKTLLLCGKPGTGKSFFAKSLIYEAWVATERYPIIANDIDAVIDFIDSSAYHNKKIIVLLDDLEVGIDGKNIDPKILHAISDLNKKNIIFVITTNLDINKVNPAFWRNGRCAAYVEFPMINKNNIKDIVTFLAHKNATFTVADLEEAVFNYMKNKKDITIADIHAIIKNVDNNINNILAPKQKKLHTLG